MMSFIPLHLNAIERHPPLRSWLTSWLGKETEFLDPKDWFCRGHDHDGGSYDERGFWRVHLRPGIYVWSPAPAAAEVALEELRKAVIKRQESTHVFVCPRLLSVEWRKQLFKAADLVINIASGSVDKGWPSAMFEPLTIGFIFPFLPFKPWQRRGTPKMCALARELSSLSDDSELVAGYILRQFFSKQQRLHCMSECVVRKMLYFL